MDSSLCRPFVIKFFLSLALSLPLSALALDNGEIPLPVAPVPPPATAPAPVTVKVAKPVPPVTAPRPIATVKPAPETAAKPSREPRVPECTFDPSIYNTVAVRANGRLIDHPYNSIRETVIGLARSGQCRFKLDCSAVMYNFRQCSKTIGLEGDIRVWTSTDAYKDMEIHIAEFPDIFFAEQSLHNSQSIITGTVGEPYGGNRLLGTEGAVQNFYRVLNFLRTNNICKRPLQVRQVPLDTCIN